MENTTFHSIQEIDDISSQDEYQVAINAGVSEEEALKAVSCFSRDNARTPMQWSPEENAGFTAGTPWLKVNPNYKKINVKAQEDDENSVLGFYKKLIALRKNPEYKETIVYGEVIPYLEEEKNLIGYLREGDKKLLVLANFQKESRKVQLPGEVKEILINNLTNISMNGKEIELGSYQYVMLLMA